MIYAFSQFRNCKIEKLQKCPSHVIDLDEDLESWNRIWLEYETHRTSLPSVLWIFYMALEAENTANIWYSKRLQKFEILPICKNSLQHINLFDVSWNDANCSEMKPIRPQETNKTYRKPKIKSLLYLLWNIWLRTTWLRISLWSQTYI